MPEVMAIWGQVHQEPFLFSLSSSLLLTSLNDENLLAEVLSFLVIQDVCHAEVCCKYLTHVANLVWKRWDLEQGEEVGKTSMLMSRTAKQRVCKYRTARDVANLEWKKLSSQEEQVNYNGRLCHGCCIYDDFQPNNMYGMEFFISIGRRRIPVSTNSTASSAVNNNNTELVWQGFVPNTCNSLLIQTIPLEEKWIELEGLLQVLNAGANHKTVVTHTTRGISNAVQRIQADTTLLVVGVPYNGYPKLLMAATPSNRHLQLHWDDSSYNHHDYSTAGMENETRGQGEDEFPCLHLWLEMRPGQSTLCQKLIVDKCSPGR